jgi:hypothetical protein
MLASFFIFKILNKLTHILDGKEIIFLIFLDYFDVLKLQIIFYK